MATLTDVPASQINVPKLADWHGVSGQMLIGYARVSMADQDLALQTDALTKAGCEKLFTDKASGAKAARPGLSEALDFVRAGDTLVIWKLDRLGRSIQGLIELAADLSARKVDFRSLTDGFDTATPSGRLLFHILASVAEMERELIKERTIAGLAAVRARGGIGGDRKSVMTPDMLNTARKLLAAGDTPAKVARLLQVGRSTFYRHFPASGREPACSVRANSIRFSTAAWTRNSSSAPRRPRRRSLAIPCFILASANRRSTPRRSRIDCLKRSVRISARARSQAKVLGKRRRIAIG